MQVSMTAHQTADQVQQKGKRIGENVRQQVLPTSAYFVLHTVVLQQLLESHPVMLCSGMKWTRSSRFQSMLLWP